ncbi:MAG: hypothetical protein AAB650_00795 [Patescibacteria group bacterium]
MRSLTRDELDRLLRADEKHFVENFFFARNIEQWCCRRHRGLLIPALKITIRHPVLDRNGNQSDVFPRYVASCPHPDCDGPQSLEQEGPPVFISRANGIVLFVRNIRRGLELVGKTFSPGRRRNARRTE